MSSVSPEIVISAVEAARQQSPAGADPSFARLRQARIGTPALVHSPGGRPEFWLVPLLAGDQACGVANVDLSGRVTRLAILGGSADDRASWIPASFFQEPPRGLLDEIRARLGPDISAPLLSYDATPARWAWLVNVLRDGRMQTRVFISPSGWYERRPGAAPGEYAG